VGRGATGDHLLSRLQVVAAVLPLAFIAVLVVAISALHLPAWAGVVISTAIAMPFVFGFAFIVFGIVGRMRDELLQREERFRGLLESAPDAIIIVDEGGRIVIVNEQATHVFGFARDELLGQQIEMLLPEDVRVLHARHRVDYSRRPNRRPMGVGLTLTGRRKDGSTFPAEISLSPIDSEEEQLVTSVVRDITERRRMEEERHRLLAEREAERERQRIGMDLHDGVIQSIYAVGLSLEAAAEEMAEDPGEVRRRLDRAIEQLNDTISDIRSYIFELRPSRFSGDLRESLASLVEEFRVNSLVDVELEITAALPVLSAEGSTAVFHIAQEALSNVRKHARATSVRVLVETGEGGVRLTVRDNGVGFDAADSFPDDHRGLRNMTSRAEGAGGTLSVESAPAAGTRVRLDVPAAIAAGEAR